MQIRQATNDDLGFVIETFLRSFRSASTHAEGASNNQIVGAMQRLRLGGWLTCVAESEGYLQGWAVYGGPGASFDVRDPGFKINANHLAWIYVRDMFRGEAFKPHVAKTILRWAMIDTEKRIVTPFLPNRTKGNWKFVHRPFLVI
jgi:hypothetical protein